MFTSPCLRFLPILHLLRQYNAISLSMLFPTHSCESSTIHTAKPSNLPLPDLSIPRIQADRGMSTTAPSAATPTPLVACLESFLSPAVSIPASPSSPALHLLTPSTLSKLRNLGHSRIRDARALGHTIQVISHIPIETTPQMFLKLNDALDAGTRMQNDKLVGLAVLPSGLGEGREAARELQRCVTKFRFVGGVVAAGRGIEDESYEEVWGMAQRLGVPIMLREGWPHGDRVRCCLLRRRGREEKSVDERRSQITLKTYRTARSRRWSRTCTAHMSALRCK
jgi:predicted TIM-barrel fold metal-dependent hydrolase